jgi:hypothetical protein
VIISFGNEYSSKEGALELYAGQGDNTSTFGTIAFFNANNSEILTSIFMMFYIYKRL